VSWFSTRSSEADLRLVSREPARVEWTAVEAWVETGRLRGQHRCRANLWFDRSRDNDATIAHPPGFEVRSLTSVQKTNSAAGYDRARKYETHCRAFVPPTKEVPCCSTA